MLKKLSFFDEKVKQRQMDESVLIENWFPLLSALTVRQPKTYLYPLPSFVFDTFVAYTDSRNDKVQKIGQQIVDNYFTNMMREVTEQFGTEPYFTKLSAYSNKHHRETITSLTSKELELMIYDSILVGACKNKDHQSIAFREFIYIDGEPLIDYSVLPIGTERRVFVTGSGEHLYTLNYWVEEAVKSSDSDSTKRYLDNVNKPETPRFIVEQAMQAGLLLSNHYDKIEAWSIDFALDREGVWWLIDIAPACSSWGWNGDI